MGNSGNGGGYDYSYVQNQLNAQRQALQAQQRRKTEQHEKKIRQLQAKRLAKIEADKQAKIEDEKTKLALQKKMNPEQYGDFTKKRQTQFVESLRTYKFSQVIKPKIGSHYCFVGPTSAGKSSLCNALFKLNLPIGLGSCTKEAKEIHKAGNVTYWDAPGINKDFGFYKPHHLGFFNDLDKIFVLFTNEVGDVALILKVFTTMKKNVILVRTKCDTYNSSHSKTLQEELQNDLRQAKLISPNISHVIGVGKGTYEKLRPFI